jgi:hypothetical protein
MKVSNLGKADLVGLVASALLFLSLFLPWFVPSETNPNSKIYEQRSPGVFAGEPGGFNAFQSFDYLQWMLILMGLSPIVLTYIVLRSKTLEWQRGEVTAIMGLLVFIFVLCNGVILGKPGGVIEGSFSIGYPIALLSGLVMTAAGVMRTAEAGVKKKPPGV